VQQNEPEDEDCVVALCRLLADPVHCARRAKQVRLYNVPAGEAKGPVHARSMQSRMVDSK
jgi:hypothetical protein